MAQPVRVDNTVSQRDLRLVMMNDLNLAGGTAAVATAATSNVTAINAQLVNGWNTPGKKGLYWRLPTHGVPINGTRAVGATLTGVGGMTMSTDSDISFSDGGNINDVGAITAASLELTGPLAVSSGGTGASAAAGARDNLDAGVISLRMNSGPVANPQNLTNYYPSSSSGFPTGRLRQ